MPKPGAQLEERDLAAFLTGKIPEAAAVPKRIFVVSEMPLTAVGKIFKPELRRRAAEAVFRERVKDLDGVSVHAILDPRAGVLVQVSVEHEELRAAVDARLGGFLIKHEVISRK